VSIIVFCGPTLDAATASAQLPGADCRPPAAQGDLYLACRERPQAIALIDGFFLDRPSVWHREILAALDAGIPVWGAASMGALRAVECAAFGMTGIGKIVEAYRSGTYPPYRDPFEDDAEVAVIHAPAELGWKPLSSALVDIRESLARAETAAAIDRPTRDRLLDRLRTLPFPERSFAALLAVASEGLDAAAAARRTAGLRAHLCSQKREDALALLAALRAPPPDRTSMPWRFEHTLEWMRFEGGALEPPNEAEQRALDALARNPADARAIRRRAAARLAAMSAAVPPRPLNETLSDFRHDRGLLSRALLDAWLAEHALPEEAFERLLVDEARLETLADAIAPQRLARAMLDELRIDGRFVEKATGGAR
jgi:hypothetical protein